MKSNQGEKIIIVKENREGCFLQTLNVGCALIFAIVGLLVLGSCWMMHKATEDTPAMPHQTAESPKTKGVPKKIVPSSPWTTRERIDSITDKRIITLYTTGSFLDHDDSTDPCFFIRLTTEDDGIHCETFFSLKWITVDDCDAQIRFDTDPAFSVKCHKSTDLQGGFLNDPHDIVQKICKHRNMTIRFRTLGGEIVTMDFPIRDLQNHLDAATSKLKSHPLARETASTPSERRDDKSPVAKPPQALAQPSTQTEAKPTARPTAAPEPTVKFATCSKCKGKGVAPVQASCSKCGGVGRIYVNGKWTSCPKKVTTGKRKCDDCDGSGTIDVVE